MTRRLLPIAAMATVSLLATALTSLPAQAAGSCYSPASNYASGTGDPSDPYIVATPAELQRLLATPADWAASFQVAANLSMTQNPGGGTCVWEETIGTIADPFTGQFNGNGKTISGLGIDIESAEPVAVSGLFGVVDTSGSVSGVRFGGNVNANGPGALYVGTIVGHNYGAVSDVQSTGTVTATSVGSPAEGALVRAGGIVGFADAGSSLSTATSSTTVSAVARGDAMAGGIVGAAFGTTDGATSTASVTSQSLEAYAFSGGIAGLAEAPITNSTSSSTVSTSATADESGDRRAWAGGITGLSTAELTKNRATGSVTAAGSYANAGGLAGETSAAVAESSATGSVTASTSSGGHPAHAGGLIGQATGGLITESYATGAALARATGAGSDAFSGGIAGSTSATDVTRVFARGNSRAEATGEAYSGGIAGQTTAGTLTQVYAAGTPTAGGTGTPRVGGAVGNNAGATAAISFWNSTLAGAGVAAVGAGGALSGATGSTTEAMKTVTTYSNVGWDIASGYRGGVGVWSMCAPVNDGYPVLSAMQTSNGCEQLTPTTQTISGHPGTAITSTPALTATGFTAAATYTVSPALPAGLTINASTGVISGTPTVVHATATHTITGTAAGVTEQETATSSVVVTVSNQTLSPATQTISGHRGTAIAATTAFTATGFTGAVTYTVTPALPTGLLLSPSTGVISGTPTVVHATATHTITGTSGTQTATATVSITVDNPTLSPATQTISAEKGTAIAATTAFTATGFTGAVTYTVTPALPTGLLLSPSTGVISGTPTVVHATATHTITGTSGTQTATATVSITVGSGTPAVPTNVSVSAGDRSVIVTWTAPATGAASVTSYRATASPGGKTCTATPPATTCTITDLTNGTAYTVTVAAQNAQGWGSESTPSTSVTPGAKPDTPTEVTAKPIIGGAAISWKAVSGAASYTATATPSSASCTATAPEVKCTIENLTAGTEYSVSVTATNAMGTSAGSTPVKVTPVSAPGPVVGISARGRNNSVTVTWKAPENTGGSPIVGYNWRVGDGPWKSVKVRGVLIKDLVAGEEVAIEVRARTAAGQGQPVQVSATPTSPATGVLSLTGRKALKGATTLTWKAPASLGGGKFLGYQVSVSGQKWRAVKTTRIVLRSLPKGKPATVRVRAVTSGGPGAIAETQLRAR